MLASMVKCFEAQTYQNKWLYILDDSGQFDNYTNESEKWCIRNTKSRFSETTGYDKAERCKNLSEKFNTLFYMATDTLDYYWRSNPYIEERKTLISIWEDDDVYLPHHLERISNIWIDDPLINYQFIYPTKVYSNYGCPKDGDKLIKEDSTGRFHASWAYTVPLFKAVGGYRGEGRLTFDQEMRRDCLQIINQYKDNSPDNTIGMERRITLPIPSYVYRWGSGPYNGSQAGDSGFEQLQKDLEEMPCEYVGRLNPDFDEETRRVYQRYFDGDLP